jgi:transcription antitermination factor NusG
MNSSEVTPDWLALTVRPQHEKAVQRYLTDRLIEAYVPLHTVSRRWSDRVKAVDVALFPRYVFCRSAFENRFTVLRAPGVQSIVSFGGVPAAIADSEIEALKCLIASKLPLRLWPYLYVGAGVRIRSGPLAGLEGIVVREKSACRVVVSVNALQRSVAVEVEESLLEPVRVSAYEHAAVNEPAMQPGRI